MITGKNKERFKIFYETIKGGNYKIPYQNFMAYPFEMQQGVYLAYYDSLKIIICVDVFEDADEYIWHILEEDCMSPFFKSAECDLLNLPNSRNEAFAKAFNKADELENKKLK